MSIIALSNYKKLFYSFILIYIKIVMNITIIQSFKREIILNKIRSIRINQIKEKKIVY